MRHINLHRAKTY